ncbi:hypothetical protein U9M48_043924 [Paspalum notatum var. saurae]|uniref:Uncharacterized protein n=1 Tax=Paspalum notatum var. saurae TaxID=547442 RepID=A0AAQ3XHN4_PASNO
MSFGWMWRRLSTSPLPGSPSAICRELQQHFEEVELPHIIMHGADAPPAMPRHTAVMAGARRGTNGGGQNCQV